MKKLISMILIVVTLFACIPLSGCFEGEAVLAKEIGSLRAGTSVQIQYKRNETEIPVTDFYYASEDPGIANVTDEGVISAVKQGETVIHVQNKNKPTEKMTIPVTVYYEVAPASETVEGSITREISNPEMYTFWNEHDYVQMFEKGDLLEIAKMIINKNEGDYVFTKAEGVYEGRDVVLIPISDWGEDQESFHRSLVEFDLLRYVSEKAQIEPYLFCQLGVERATTSMKNWVGKQIGHLQGEIDFSLLPDNMEYRVFVKANYTVYRTTKYYSRGLLKGGFSALKDLFGKDHNSFLESYTYTETLYELDLTYCSLVIEERAK